MNYSQLSKTLLFSLTILLSFKSSASSSFFGSKIDGAKVEKISSAKLKADSLALLVNNDEAFAAKIKAIREANQSIRMMYFIFSDDETSSFLVAELLKAASRGVKVDILLDYHQAYAHFDYLKMIEETSKAAAKLNGTEGRVEFRLYNRPTINVIQDAAFFAAGCGTLLSEGKTRDACSKNKVSKIKDAFGKNNDLNSNVLNSGLVLSGLYGKDPEVLALAMADNIESLQHVLGETSGEEVSDEQKESLRKFAKLIWDSKTGNFFESFAAKVKLTIAFSVYGDQLNPIYNLMSGLIPINLRGKDENREKEWLHFTDYIHHKFLLADDKYLVMGGRNIENSYHESKSALTNKYLFMDTDVFISLQDGALELNKTFERLWNFREMVATLNDVSIHAPFEVMGNLIIAREECENEESEEKKKCIVGKIENPKSEIERIQFYLGKLEDRLERYMQYMPEEQLNELTAKITSDVQAQLNSESADTLKIDYLENLPFQRRSKELKRGFGIEKGVNHGSNKNIHAALINEVKKLCQITQKSGEKHRVIFHNAYFSPSSNLLTMFKKMVNGNWDCHNIEVSIITNSFETTDLSPVNHIGRHVIRPFFDYLKNVKNAKSANFRYFEYIKSESNLLPSGKAPSLHSKVTVVGNANIFVGSANLDLRSYIMDTNNAVYIQNAESLVANYTAFIDEILGDSGRIIELTSRYLDLSFDELLLEDIAIINYTFHHYQVERFLDASRVEELKSRILELLKNVNDLAISILTEKKNQNRSKYFDKLLMGI